MADFFYLGLQKNFELKMKEVNGVLRYGHFGEFL